MKTTMSQGEKYIDVASPQAAIAKHLAEECPPDKLPLILESGNVWWYPIENCTRIATTQKEGAK